MLCSHDEEIGVSESLSSLCAECKPTTNHSPIPVRSSGREIWPRLHKEQIRIFHLGVWNGLNPSPLQLESGEVRQPLLLSAGLGALNELFGLK